MVCIISLFTDEVFLTNLSFFAYGKEFSIKYLPIGRLVFAKKVKTQSRGDKTKKVQEACLLPGLFLKYFFYFLKTITLKIDA